MKQAVADGRSWTEETDFIRANCIYCDAEILVSKDEDGEYPIDTCPHYKETDWVNGQIIFQD